MVLRGRRRPHEDAPGLPEANSRRGPVTVAVATFASVTAAVGSGYWWESDWTVYIDDGQGERRPFDEFTGWWQAVESGFVGAVAGWAVVAACASAWLFWSLLARGVPVA